VDFTKPDGIITQMTVLFIGGLEHKLLSQCSKIVEQQKNSGILNHIASE
jgi:hypothetical protein